LQIERAKLEIAEISESVLEFPEKNVRTPIAYASASPLTLCSRFVLTDRQNAQTAPDAAQRQGH
jgi:hypothetical protein